MSFLSHCLIRLQCASLHLVAQPQGTAAQKECSDNPPDAWHRLARKHQAQEQQKHRFWPTVSCLLSSLIFCPHVLNETGADLIRVPVHSPPSLCGLQARCHSHRARHQSRHRGEYSDAHWVSQKSFQRQSHSLAGG